MKQHVLLFVIATCAVGLIYLIYEWNRDVETIDKLIGKNYQHAEELYFRRPPDGYFEININDGLTEFHNGIYNNKKALIESKILVFTWDFLWHKKTIWVGHTSIGDSTIIDAIRYNNNIVF